MIKIARTVKLDETIGLVSFGSHRDFLNLIIFQIGHFMALLGVNYNVHERTCCPI